MNPSQFRKQIELLQQQTATTEYDFQSDMPILGPIVQKVRQTWNNVSARWYVRHYAKQQLQFQQTLIQTLSGMYESLREEDERRSQQIAARLDKLATSLREGDVRDQMLKQDIDAIVRQLTRRNQTSVSE